MKTKSATFQNLTFTTDAKYSHVLVRAMPVSEMDSWNAAQVVQKGHVIDGVGYKVFASASSLLLAQKRAQAEAKFDRDVTILEVH